MRQLHHFGPMSSEVIHNLYHAFRRVRQPLKVTGCTHCCTTDAELKSLEKGVHDAPKFAVATLAHNGMTTVGSQSDYRYFLPRILHEIFIDIDFWFLCVDALTTRIKDAGFDSWSETERLATVAVLHAIFSEHCEELDRVDLEDWLYAIACVDFDVRPYLSVIDERGDEDERHELIFDVLLNIRSKEGEPVKLAHGVLTSAQYDPIYRWVASKF